MKQKLFVPIGLALFLFLAGDVLAVTPKPPANICLEMLTNPLVFSGYLPLVVKPVASMTMANGPTNYYALNGWIMFGGNSMAVLLSGTGHMDKNTNGLFHFSVKGSGAENGPTLIMIHVEGYWNVITKTGSGSGRFSAKEFNSTLEDHNYSFNFLEIPCGNIPNPATLLNP